MKVLIVSHNPVSDQSNMGKTFLSLFSEFGAEQLCQLYIYPTVPSGRHCASSYRITDKDALLSCLKSGPAGGEIPCSRIGTVRGNFEHPGDEKLYRSRKNKRPLRRLLRDAIWRMARWDTPQLRAWLDREEPDCIFAAPGGAKFLYDLALKIAEDRNLPLVTYLCDEHYFVKSPAEPLDKLRLTLLQRKMEALLARSAHLVTISQELKAQYESHFGLKTSVLMTGSRIVPSECGDAQPRQICYFGNIRCGRYRSLIRVARTLDSLNREQGSAWKLRIYTAEQDEQILSRLRPYQSLELCPFVSGEAFDRALKGAGLLLHVEDFAPESVDAVRHSVSTKIADSLASGVPLVAFGPAGIASMEHLRRNGCALLSDAPDKLRATLLTAFTDAQIRQHIVQNALETAKKFHSSAAVSTRLLEILEDVSRKRPMKVLQINNFYGENSTGKLTEDLQNALRRRGIQTVTVYGRGNTSHAPDARRLCPEWYARANSLWARISGLPYGGCLLSTLGLQAILRREKPDVVHLQCINGNFVNLYRLIGWLNRRKIKTVLSLHAEFLYTANCGHAFDCSQWHRGCNRCPNPRQANRSLFFDRTAQSWRKMHRAFRGFEENAVLCPVSDWTQQRAKQSDILKNIPMKTVHNGVNTACFCPGTGEKEGYILHVTARFSTKPDHPKGGGFLLELARRMPEIPFFVAGKGEKITGLPPNVTLLGPVTDQKVLAELYRKASLTVLTSRRETFSLPVAESLCCGTPVVGFRAGGPEEIALPEFSEFVPFGDLDALESAVRRWLTAHADPAPAARNAYDTAKMAAQFEEIYRSLHER